jgi:hypothetical protein
VSGCWKSWFEPNDVTSRLRVLSVVGARSGDALNIKVVGNFVSFLNRVETRNFDIRRTMEHWSWKDFQDMTSNWNQFCSFFWFSRFASWCNMSVWCYATCQPYTFLTKRKGLIKYIWHTHSRWQFALNPMISSNDTIYEMWLAYPHKSIIYRYTDTSPLIPQVAPVCLMLHK